MYVFVLGAMVGSASSSLKAVRKVFIFTICRIYLCLITKPHYEAVVGNYVIQHILKIRLRIFVNKC